MTIIEVKNRKATLINELLEVQEDSVKATHLFLSNEEIKNIKEYVPQALKEIENLTAMNVLNMEIVVKGVHYEPNKK